MDREALASWLITRFTGDQAQGEWRMVCATGVRLLLGQPLAEIVPRATFERSLDVALNHESNTTYVRALAHQLLTPVVEEMRADTEPLQRWCPDRVQEHLETIITQDGFINEAWIDAIMAQEATRSLFAEALVQGLDEFTEMVPQMVQGFAPSGLGRIAARIQEATGGVSERFREEMRRRFEPEIRRFAERASPRLIESTFGAMKANLDKPSYKEARRNLFRHGLAQSPASYSVAFSPEGQTAWQEALDAWSEDAEVRGLVRSGLLSVYDRVCHAHAGQPVKDILNASDTALSDELVEGLADTMWPWVREIMHAEALQPLFEKLAEDLLKVMSQQDSPDD